jgi:glutamate-ammonia-ligase adenylyltransferase
MRKRMRNELDRSSDDRFDLKQGKGGLVDLEFLLQYLVLTHAHARPGLLQPRSTAELIATLVQCGVIADARRDALVEAHALLLQRSLDCTLDRRPRVVACDSRIDTARSTIREACRAHRIDFDIPADTAG